MTQKALTSCPDCSGFIPPTADHCPNCHGPSMTPTRAARVARAVLGMGTGGLLAMTLMACYGLPPCDPDDTSDPYCATPTYCEQGQDLDEDMSCTPDDCADSDPMVHPMADDPLGDEIDQNCDGVDGVKDS